MFDWLEANWAEVVLVVLAVTKIADAVVKFTPNIKDDEIWGQIRKVIAKFIALNPQ